MAWKHPALFSFPRDHARTVGAKMANYTNPFICKRNAFIVRCITFFFRFFFLESGILFYFFAFYLSIYQNIFLPSPLNNFKLNCKPQTVTWIKPVTTECSLLYFKFPETWYLNFVKIAERQYAQWFIFPNKHKNKNVYLQRSMFTLVV